MSRQRRHSSFSLADIPPEIISQLLLAYRSALGEAPLRGLRNICLTCRDWRDIAYSTPELWSTIDLHLRERMPAALVDNLQILLERSREQPLTVLLKFHSHPWLHVGDRDRATAFIHLLFGQVHRWRIVHFEFLSAFFPYFPEMDRLKADNLESLHISTSRNVSLPLSWISVLAGSPRLRAWKENGGSSYAAALPLMQNLKILEIAIPTLPSKVFRILKSLPSLEHLSTSLDREANPAGTITPLFTMMKSLNLSLSAYSSLQLFFLGIHAPNLESLELRFPEFSSFNSHMASVKDFLKRTDGQITSFSVRNMCITEDDFLDCLAILSPHLKRLEILADPTLTSADYYAIENITERTIQALTYTPEQQPLCPQLEHLTLERCIQAEDGALSDMVYSRYRSQHSQLDSPSRLSFLRIVFRYHSHPIDAYRLQRLRAEGLDCQVRYGSTRASSDHLVGPLELFY